MEDLSPYREWFIKLLKYSNKLQSTVDSDFLQEFNQLCNAQGQLHEVMQKNEELERKNLKLQAKVERHKGGGDAYNSRNDGFGSGSYDENERSFNNNSYSDAKAEESGNRAIIESL